MWNYRAALLSVHDGDTITLLIDTGFNGRHEEAIRLKGVFAPELSQLGGPETRDYLLNYCTSTMLSGKWPLVINTEPTNTTVPTEKMTFTRYVGTVWIGSTALPSLNDIVNEFLKAHPEWPHGVGA